MLAGGAACGGAPPPAPAEPAAPPRESYTGPLAALLPEGAGMLVLARPAQVYGSPALRRVALSIVPDERLESYAVHTGIDPRRVEELVWAEYDDATVILVRGPFDAPFAAREMAERMLPLEEEADTPFLRRSGHYQSARRDLVALSENTLMVVTGTPARTGELIARAREGAEPEPGALGAAHVAALLAERAGDPFVLVAPRPLDLPRSTGVGLLLSREEALAVGASAAAAETLALAVDLRGEFPPGAAENFRTLVTSIAESDMGSALGMRDALSTLSVEASAERVVLRAEIPAVAVAGGLHLLFAAEIEELVGEPEGAGGDL